MMRTVAAAVCAALVPILASAQTVTTGADLSGTVRDPTGGVVPGARVTVLNLESNATRTAATDAVGRYRVAALAAGRYRVTVEAAGFGPVTHEDVHLAIGQLAEVDVTLALAGRSETITVSTSAPLVDPRRTAISSVIDQQQIDQLPINGRNFISFSIITPGVTTDRTPQQGASATSGLSFGGQRARSNNIMVDGYDNNDAVVGAVSAVFSQEAVREFQVLTNSYSAEFGRASAGVVNIVTKSGTNRYDGNFFSYFRDESLNAKDHFEKFDVFGNPIERDKAPYGQTQWGGTVGGPIRRDRSFFFASFEKLDINTNNFVTIADQAAALLRANGFPVDVGNVPYDYRFTQGMGKVDQRWSSERSLSVRGHVSDVTNENIEPFGGLVAKSRGAVQQRMDWSLAASETDVIRTMWVNEARAYYRDTDQDVQSLDPLCDGVCDSNFEGGPTVEISGVASAGRHRFTPVPRKNRTLHLADTLSRAGALHTIRTGAEYYAQLTKDGGGALPLHFGGRYIFAPLPAVPALGIPAPISALQAFELGLPAAYVQGYGNPDVQLDYQSIAAFVQDDWRLANVTLKLGLRYQKQFWPETPFTVPVPGTTPLSYTFPSDNDNFAPRTGVAWDLRGDGRTVVRAAYGIYFDDHITSINGVPDILDGTTGVRTLVLAFPNSIAPWRAPGHRISEPSTAYPSLIFTVDPNLKNPFAHHVSVGMDRAITNALSVSVSGVYFRGHNQVGTVDYNPVVPSLGARRRPNDINGVADTSASLLQYTSFGETWYKGLTVAADQRFGGGHQLRLAYTLSKAEDNSSDFQSAFIPETNGLGRNPADPEGLPLAFNPDLERGPATHDQRHRLVVDGTYRLPYDMYLSGIFTAASGHPFTPLAGFDWNGDGNGGAFPPDRARLTPGPTGTPAFDSVGRNSETMNAQVTMDVRVSKRISFGGASLEAMIEVFNLFNRANFSEINNIFGAGAYPTQPATDAQGRVTYGRYEQALSPRQVQLAFKVTF